MPARLYIRIPAYASYLFNSNNIPHSFSEDGYCYTDGNAITNILDDPLDFDIFMTAIAEYATDDSWVIFKRNNDTLCLSFCLKHIYRCEKPIGYFYEPYPHLWFNLDPNGNIFVNFN